MGGYTLGGKGAEKITQHRKNQKRDSTEATSKNLGGGGEGPYRTSKLGRKTQRGMLKKN